MAKIVLLNDVDTDLDKSHLIVGSRDVAANASGENQADEIVNYLYDKISVSAVYSSPALRLKKLLHLLRVKCPGLLNKKIEYSNALAERSFGVLQGCSYSMDSDLFRHTRICAERGESIRQCKERGISQITAICKNEGVNTLVVSHPFMCQILTNVFLGKDHTLLTKFWFTKGSYIDFRFKIGRYGLQWAIKKAANGLSKKEYGEDEIYKDIVNV